MVKIRLVLILILFITNSSKAQLINISGKIADAENNAPLAGVSIKVLETQHIYSSDVEGRFLLQLAPNKKYSLLVTSLGYLSKQVTDVTADNTASLEISLKRAKANVLNEVTVKSSAKKETIASIYSLQKNSSSISDGISAEVIKKSPDRNIGDVLKRVSGASVQDNKFVVVRGLNERYNISMLNNAVLPSTEPDKKAFSFDIIPSSLIDNLLIYKSATPDLPGDFSGGAIKILTKDYPSQKISELSFSAGFNTLTTFQNFYVGYPNGNLDALGFVGNSRAIPAAYKQYGSSFILQSNDVKKQVTKLFPNTFGSGIGYKSYPNLSFSYLNGNTKVLSNGHKLGYIYSIAYSASRKVSERTREDYQNYSFPLFQNNTNTYDQRANLSALLNVTYAYRRSKISIKNLFNNDFSKLLAKRNGYDISNTPQYFYTKSENTEAQQNGLFNSVMEGVHALSKGWGIDWNTSYSYAYRKQPDQKIISFRTPYDNSTNYFIKLNNENSPEIRNAGRVYANLGESIYGANVNVIKSFEWLGKQQKIKGGASTYYRDRNVTVDALGYASLDYNGRTIYEDKNISFGTIFSPDNIDNLNLTLANIATNSVSYTANGWLTTAYAMFDGKLLPSIKLTAGARVENYKQELMALNQATIRRSDLDVLPSALITYSLNNTSNIRIAASQAVNRPEFRELAAYSVFDYENYVVVRGNPGLTRSKNTNVDLRYELFPNPGEIISFSVFYKYFDKPIEQVNKGNDVLSYENADKANAYGAEIEIRKKLGFIQQNGFFDRLAVYTNLAYIDGSVKFGAVTFNTPLQGQSPYLINSGLLYTSKQDDFSVNLLYNRIGPRLKFRSVSGGALNIFEKPRDLLDLQISKKLMKDKLELKLTVSDILAQPFVWYYKFDANPSSNAYDPAKDRIINSVNYGTTSTLSVRFKFN
ncbi:MAG: TonB-dependent receptor [Bacteroidota bacterium]|nr:TonB-dependent receptor [Bacteroidota bacterium]